MAQELHTYDVRMQELRDGRVRTLHQTARCASPQQVIDFYGLNEPDIIDFVITPID